VELGVAAAEVEAIHVRELRVAEGAPEHELGARLAKQVEVLGVVELKRRVARDADPVI